MNKVPVRIVQSQDMHGNKKVGVMLDLSYYGESPDDAEEKIKQFKELYFKTLQKAKDLYKATKKKKNNSKYYWRLSRLLQEFNSLTENEFVITNYRTALERDFNLTDSYIGVIFDLGKFFNEDEILEEIPMSVYFELTIKKRKLEKLGLFEKEKHKLLSMAKEGRTIEHKEYRRILSNTIKNYSRK